MIKTDENQTKTVILRASQAPDEVQKERLLAFLTGKYGCSIELSFVPDETLQNGFILEAGTEVFDWTPEAHLAEYRRRLMDVIKGNDEVVSLIREYNRDWKPEISAQEIGIVQTVGDGIATIDGLDCVTYGEILYFECGIKGMVQDLRKGEVGCILFGDDTDVMEGSKVYRTGKTAGIPCADEYIGRVVDALGAPIDGGAEIEADEYRPVETPAPGIVDRQPVNRPMETGLLAIDSMFPIGRGQRELIIGDRQTGKTTIAIDTILNQKGKDVICIYVAIGQKISSVAQLAENLRKRGAMDYTIIVNASASDPVPLQYIAPYAGCALGEYFMDKGRDVLIVYDDLSKHAIAYRALSLLLERSPGREAYPGDVFYLHSRLLERAAHLSDERGGGSMTALPIVETQAGDVSAYIPTNIISITDGQIFLESNLFFAGQRPAVNVGLSVSRVGGDAQTKAMKKASGALRLELAQYREIEMFTQFSSDLDESTRKQVEYGQGLMKMLIQPQNRPYCQHQQVIILVMAMNKTMLGIPKEKIGAFIRDYVAFFEEKESALCQSIDRNGTISEEDLTLIRRVAKDFRENYR